MSAVGTAWATANLAGIAKVTVPGGPGTVVATITGPGYQVFQPKVHL
jgi:hypothetical protein